MDKIKISAISYLNTSPFIYGIQESGFLSNYEMEMDYPAACAEKLIHNKVDIGIVPIAILPLLKHYTILSDYCIGANGAAGSVLLYSQVPLQEIENIYLDYQSRSSIALVQIIAKHFWKISPNWIKAETGYEEEIFGTTAGVIIGDRTFSMKNKYKYAYDLSEEWQHFTGFPFVFACWITNKELPLQFTDAFRKAIKYGIDNKQKLIQELEKDNKSAIDIAHYLNNCISYELDEAKRKGMQLFLNYLKQ